METKKEQIIIKAGTMVNRSTHEDDDYFIAQKDLPAKVIKCLPGVV